MCTMKRISIAICISGLVASLFAPVYESNALGQAKPAMKSSAGSSTPSGQVAGQGGASKQIKNSTPVGRGLGSTPQSGAKAPTLPKTLKAAPGAGKGATVTKGTATPPKGVKLPAAGKSSLSDKSASPKGKKITTTKPSTSAAKKVSQAKGPQEGKPKAKAPKDGSSKSPASKQVDVKTTKKSPVSKSPGKKGKPAITGEGAGNQGDKNVVQEESVEAPDMSEPNLYSGILIGILVLAVAGLFYFRWRRGKGTKVALPDAKGNDGAPPYSAFSTNMGQSELDAPSHPASRIQKQASVSSHAMQGSSPSLPVRPVSTGLIIEDSVADQSFNADVSPPRSAGPQQIVVPKKNKPGVAS